MVVRGMAVVVVVVAMVGSRAVAVGPGDIAEVVVVVAAAVLGMKVWVACAGELSVVEAGIVSMNRVGVAKAAAIGVVVVVVAAVVVVVVVVVGRRFGSEWVAI